MDTNKSGKGTGKSSSTPSSNVIDTAQTMFVVAVSEFNGSTERPATEDKNGYMPVVLTSVTGDELPERSQVISGTIANNAGLVPGETVSVAINRVGETSYKDAEGNDAVGINYNYVKLHTLSFMDLLQLQAINGQKNQRRATPQTQTSDAGVEFGATK